MSELPALIGDGRLGLPSLSVRVNCSFPIITQQQLDPKCFESDTGGDEHTEFVERGWVDFWAAYQSHLISQGYELYGATDFGDGYISRGLPPSLSPPPFVHPYAATTTATGSLPDDMWENPVPPAFHACAQDSSGRDVVLKLVRNDSEEYRIYALLRACPELQQAESFPSAIPILDIVVTPHDFSFIVMPRWGILPMCPELSSVCEVLFLFESLLRGLSYLHEHRIVHRDIKWDNTLINHFEYQGPFSGSGARVSLRASQRVRYCISDFNLSLIVPPETRRLPSHLAFCGASWNHPGDVFHGEFDYDPFAFDVACLGNMLASFSHLTPVIPLLAPLLDRMTTHVVARRFTAAEAHKFCVSIREGLSVTESGRILPPEMAQLSYCTTDRWAQLSPEFVKTWSSYRETPPPFHLRLLRWIGGWDLAFRFLRFVRRTLRI